MFSLSPSLCPVGMIALTRTLVLYPQVMADHPSSSSSETAGQVLSCSWAGS
ncbi:unnamed protein product [Oncorhynchus mykiss]|uniref:Uncharacterized protein n=1 Tax=Oncorhynchus mykiss TaxID=8022 RepID=A0A060Z5E7_ONCMY|nr:unnamed protein product [Oncorhynchus mykiss]